MGLRVIPWRDRSDDDPANVIYEQMSVDRFLLDFGLPFAQIGIEIEGEPWHKATAKQVKEDKKREIELNSMGWHLIRISEDFLRKRPEKAWRFIEESIFKWLEV